MKPIFFHSMLCALLCLCASIATSQAQPAHSGAANPLIWADVPDTSILRVGDTYYMSSTTMHMSPGLPIMKSKDLVNWQIAGYAYQTLADNDALTLKNGQSAYGAGSWASSLRYHNGEFIVSTFSSTTGKTHIFRTKSIESGQWTENSFRPAFHDHSLVFEEDGRVYLVHGSGDVHLTELLPDLTGIKPGGIDKTIIKNASEVAGPNVGLRAEGSQIHKINGKYYLFMITWPRGGMRTTLVFRADHLEGPYEGRVALKHRGIAQGGLVDTPGGEWYALLFQDHGAVGRIPYLLPVKWEDGWPILGINGAAPATLERLPAQRSALPAIVSSDEFNRKSGDAALPLQWQWNHNPDNTLWSLAARPGWLRLTTGRIDADLLSARNTLTQRTFGPECTAETSIDVSHMKDGDTAGLCVLQKRFGYVGVQQAAGKRKIVVVTADLATDDIARDIPVTGSEVRLRIHCDFSDGHDIATFEYSIQGSPWQRIGRPMKMVYTLPHFMGYRFGLFNFATQTAGGYVDFDYFHISN
jgi:beta-xylosidase